MSPLPLALLYLKHVLFHRLLMLLLSASNDGTTALGLPSSEGQTHLEDYEFQILL